MAEEHKYTIILLTTAGCQGCAIMHSNTLEAIHMSHKDIEYKRIDMLKDSKETEQYCKSFGVKDFPTILFFDNSKPAGYKYKYTGSMPVVVILRWIDIHFK